MHKLIYKHEDYTSFLFPWIKPIIDQYFELVEYDPGATYNPATDHVLVTYASRVSNLWYKELTDRGHRLVVDHLWDSDVAIKSTDSGQELELRCPNWMWYLACIEFSHHGYQSYKPQREDKHAFLMLMNNPRWHRDAILPLLHNVIHRGIYSYNSRGIQMPGDKPQDETTPWQRYMNPDWYNHTAFSVVAESYMRNTIDGGDMLTEVSEKLFKPLSYYHPFVVAGSAYTLDYLHKEGFETFDTWFDQSYDTIMDDRVRLGTVCSEIDRAVRRWDKREIGWDAETLRRLEHNHNHMFNRELVMIRFIKEIVDPVLEFVCKP